MNKTDKIRGGQIKIDDKHIYRPLSEPMVKETHSKVLRLITDLQTPNPPGIPEFYTLTKIHKPTITGRPIIFGCDGPTERISSFIDTLLQPILEIKESYLNDTTDFMNFIENEKVKKRKFRTNSSKTSFEENISNFKKRLIDRGYPQTMIENLLSDIKFTERESALMKHNNKEEKEILPFVTQYQPSVSTLKEVLLKKWNLTQNQPLLRQIFKEPRRKENP